MDGIAELVLSLVGPALGRFRRRLDRLPDREFSQATALQKIGRLLLCGLVLVGMGGPLLWLIFR